LTIVTKKVDAHILESSDFVAQAIDEAVQRIRQQLAGDDRMERAARLINFA
jgi:hypothetical protein